MTRPRILMAAVIGLALGIPEPLSSASSSRANAGAQSNSDNISIIIAWNEALQALTPPGPSPAQRFYSMLHVAIFDAVNAIERVLYAVSRPDTRRAWRIAGSGRRASGA